MSSFLLKLLELSLQAGVLAIAIWLFRLVFRKFPAKYLCALWAIAAVRLIVPFSLESSMAPMWSLEKLLEENHGRGTITVHLVSATESYEDGTVKQLYPGTDANDEVDYYISENKTLHTEDIEIQTQLTVPGTDSNGETDYYIVSVSPTPVPEGIANAVFDRDWRLTLTLLTPVLFGLWLLGTVLLLGYGVFSCFKVKHMVKNAIPYEDNILLCEGLESPFLFGWIHPKIYLPASLEEEQMQYVIEHERSHIARGDNYAKLIGYALLSVYWFNPLLWVAYVMFCKDVERACDERVISGFDVADRKGYADALLQCSMDHRFAISNPLAFGETDVKKRIVGILDYQKPGRWLAGIAVLLCMAAVAGCFLVKSDMGNAPGLEVLSTPTGAATPMPTQPPVDPTATPMPTQAPAVIIPARPREGSDEALLGNATKETVQRLMICIICKLMR